MSNIIFVKAIHYTHKILITFGMFFRKLVVISSKWAAESSHIERSDLRHVGGIGGNGLVDMVSPAIWDVLVSSCCLLSFRFSLDNGSSSWGVKHLGFLSPVFSTVLIFRFLHGDTGLVLLLRILEFPNFDGDIGGDNFFDVE